MGHVRTASPECLLETLETMDMGTLVRAPAHRGSGPDPGLYAFLGRFESKHADVLLTRAYLSLAFEPELVLSFTRT